jgi:hypothetical protein
MFDRPRRVHDELILNLLDELNLNAAALGISTLWCIRTACWSIIVLPGAAFAGGVGAAKD